MEREYELSCVALQYIVTFYELINISFFEPTYKHYEHRENVLNVSPCGVTFLYSLNSRYNAQKRCSASKCLKDILTVKNL